MTHYQKTFVATAIGISAALWSMAGFVAPAIASTGCAQVPGIGPFPGATCFQEEFAPLMRSGLSSSHQD